jgi:L-2-hydroxyglutarate oxidase LhgO
LVNAVENNINAELLNESQIKDIEPYANPYRFGIFSPDTAVIDSNAVVEKLFLLLKDKQVEFKFSSSLLGLGGEKQIITTQNEKISYGYIYNCAGAHADRVAKLFGKGLDYTMIPFKGNYYKLHPSKNHLVNSNIYPVPNINLPFLGVHFTKVISGDVYVGPTAIPAFGRENYGILEGLKLREAAKISSELLGMYLNNAENFRMLVHSEIKNNAKPWFLKSAQKLVAGLQSKDLILSNKVGIRPQLVNTETKSIELDYIIEQTENSMHILNSISPAFTSSFAFSEWIVDQSEQYKGE